MGGCVKIQPKETTTTTEGGYSICDTIQNEQDRYNCYLQFAVNKKESSICNKMKYENEKDFCYIKVAVAEMDSSICDKIQYQFRKDVCYLNVAKAKENLSICNIIQNPKYKEDCYSSVAYVKQDASICDIIHDQKRKNNCYTSVAHVKRDKSICEKIQNQSREYCYFYSQIVCPRSCISSDDGDIHVKGSTSYRDGSGCPTTTIGRVLYDYCASDRVLVEYDCDKNLHVIKRYIACDYNEICVDGACVKIIDK